MDLQIQLVCPKCHQLQWIHFQDISPGHRQVCHCCDTFLRMTTDSLALFAQDVRHYCEA